MKNLNRFLTFVSVLLFICTITMMFGSFNLLPSKISIYESEINGFISSNGLKFSDETVNSAIMNKFNLKGRFGRKVEVNVIKDKEVFLGGKPLGIVLRQNEKQIETVNASYENLKSGCASGIGTLSFVTSENDFAALGHSIFNTESATDYCGEIFNCKLNGVIKGKNGSPGQLCGEFGREEQRIGYVKKNLGTGIYGKVVNDDYVKSLKKVSACGRYSIKHGDAQILTTIGESTELYSIQIVRCMNGNKKNNKSFLIKVTDRNLISKTGGIVQGMSGSPIIQNDKLIGVVTHVFVRDPLRGYGIYLDWMLEDCG